MFFEQVIGSGGSAEAAIIDVNTLPASPKNAIYRTPGGLEESDFIEYTLTYNTNTKTLNEYKQDFLDNGFKYEKTQSGDIYLVPDDKVIYEKDNVNNTYKKIVNVVIGVVQYGIDPDPNVNGVAFIYDDTETWGLTPFTGLSPIYLKEAPLYNFYAGDETTNGYSRIVDKDLFDKINDTAVYSGDEEGTSEVNLEAVCDIACKTAGNVAAKIASSNNYILRSGNRFTLLFTNSNTSASALTLNVNDTGAKAIYIDGEASSSTNYTLPAGLYSVLYDGTNYQINTDNTIPGVGSGDFDRYKETIAYLTDEEETSAITDPVVHVSELAQSLSTSTTTAPSVGLVKEEIDDINTAVSDIGDSVSDLETNLGSPSSASSVTGADAFSKINTLNSDLSDMIKVVEGSKTNFTVSNGTTTYFYWNELDVTIPSGYVVAGATLKSISNAGMWYQLHFTAAISGLVIYPTYSASGLDMTVNVILVKA